MLKLVIGWGLLICVALAVFKLTGSCRGRHCGKCCCGNRDCGSCQVTIALKRGKNKKDNAVR